MSPVYTASHDGCLKNEGQYDYLNDTSNFVICWEEVWYCFSHLTHDCYFVDNEMGKQNPVDWNIERNTDWLKKHAYILPTPINKNLYSFLAQNMIIGSDYQLINFLAYDFVN